jgi:hypothetical protein
VVTDRGLRDGEDIPSRGQVQTVRSKGDLDQAHRVPPVGEAGVEVPAIGRDGQAQQAPLALGHYLPGQVEQRLRLDLATTDDPNPASPLSNVELPLISACDQRQRLVELGHPDHPQRQPGERFPARRPGGRRGCGLGR